MSGPWRNQTKLHYPYRVFVRRREGWDPHRVGVMALPVVLAVMFTGLGAVLESETPGAQEPIPHEVFCCVMRIPSTATIGAEGAVARSGSSAAFRVVYTKQESRAVEVARVIEAVGPGLSETDRRRLGELVARLSKHYGYDPALIVAMIMTESSFDPLSRSHRGAVGLMQLLPTTAASLAEETNRQWSGAHALLDPTFNISLGVRYLAKLQKQFGALDLALAAYNYGPSRVDDFIRSGRPVPMDYTNRVLERYREVRLAERSTRL